MSRNAIFSSAIFGVLLLLAVLTRPGDIRVGMREMNLQTEGLLPLQEVTVTGKHTATLKRDGSSWAVSGPQATKAAPATDGATPPPKPAPGKVLGPFLADAAAIERIVTGVGELEVTGFVTSRKEKHADLHVDADKGTHVRLKGAKVSLDLVVGRTSKGGGFFVRNKGEDDVFIAKGTLATALKKDMAAWRERALVVGTKAEDLKSLTITPAGSTPYTIERTGSEGEKSKWSLAKGTALPAGFRVDSDALSRLGRSFASLRATEFADTADTADTTAAGIQANAAVVGTRNDGTTVEVRFGADDDKRRAYAQVTGGKQLYLVSAFTRDSLQKPLLDHRNLTLFSVAPADLDRVRFETAGNVVELSKANGAWTLVSPAPPPEGFVFDPAVVDGKIAGLTRLKANAYEGSSAASPVVGTKIELFRAGGDAQTVTLGAVSGDENASKKVAAQTSLDDGAYAVASFQAKRYADALSLFKKVDRPPGPPGGARGGPGGMQGLENLPPEIRKQIEAQMRAGRFPGN